MKTSLFVHSILLLTMNLVAEESDQVVLARIGCSSSKEFVFQIEEVRVEKLPKWHPEGDKPAPISLKRACELGRTALKVKHPNIDEFEISGVSIREIVSAKKYGAWFYELAYIGKMDGKPVGSCGLFAVILMDGTSVDPVATLGKNL